VPQEIDRIIVEQVPLQVWFVLDTSECVAGPTLQQLVRAANAFLDGLQPPDRAALLTFSHQVALRQPLTEDLSAVRKALDSMPAAGSTSLHDALYAVLHLAEPRHDRAVAVVFSDGRDNLSWLGAEAVLETVRRSEVIVEAVGSSGWILPTRQHRVESAAQFRFLQEATRISGGRLWDASPRGGLRDAFVEVLEGLRTRYLITFYPSDGTRAGWHKLQVRLARGRGTAIAREGYYRQPTR
jgi:VWFA-related protein